MAQKSGGKRSWRVAAHWPHLMKAGPAASKTSLHATMPDCRGYTPCRHGRPLSWPCSLQHIPACLCAQVWMVRHALSSPPLALQSPAHPCMPSCLAVDVVQHAGTVNPSLGSAVSSTSLHATVLLNMSMESKQER